MRNIDMNVAVISPKCTSVSAKYIADNIKAHYENPYQTKREDFTEFDMVINWGCSKPVETNNVMNYYQFVANAINKLKTFQLLDGKANIVPYTTDPRVAHGWRTNVFARKTITGSKSEGVEQLWSTDLFAYLNPEYKLFTKGIDHIGEYRINVFKGKIITILEKTVKADNTFKFKLIYGEPIVELIDMVKAVDENMHLDYYGLDVIFDKYNKPILLEVNSAPSLFGTTREKFVQLFKKELSL